MIRTLFQILIPIFLISSITANARSEDAPYNPARWTATSPYVMKSIPNGPIAIHAFDSAGKLEQKATLQYSSDGRLIQESYYDASGNNSGSTVYDYKDGLPHVEKLFDSNKRLRTRTVRSFADGRVQSLAVYDNQNRLITEQTFEYNARGIAGTERVGDTIDSFFLHFQNGRPQKLEFKESGSAVFQETQYVYNSTGKLTQRIRTTAGSKLRCDHSYDSKGRLISYTYYESQNDDWRLVRTMKLIYK